MDDMQTLRIENRIRGIMKELIEPTTRRATEANDLIGKLAHKFENLQIKVEDVEVAQIKMLSKLSIMEEYNKRLQELSANQTVMDSKMQKDKQEFLTHFYSLNSVLTGVQEEVNVFEKERQVIREDLTGLSHNLMNAKYDLEQKVAAFKDDYHDRLNVLEDRMRRTEVDTDLFSQKVRKNVFGIQEVSDKVVVIQRVIEDLHDLIRKSERVIDFNKTESNSNLEIIRSSTIKLGSELIKTDKSISQLGLMIKSVEDQGSKLNLRLTEPLYQVFTDVGTQKMIAAYDLQRLGKGFENEPKDLLEVIKEKAESIMKIEVPEAKAPNEERKKRKKTTKLTVKKKNYEKNQDPEEFDYEENPSSDPFMINKPTTRSHNQKQTLPPSTRGKSSSAAPQPTTEITSITPVLVIGPRRPIKKAPSSSLSPSSSSSSSIIPEQIDFSPMISKLKIELKEDFESKLKSLSETLTNNFHTLSETVGKIDSDTRQEMSKVMNSVDFSIQEVLKKINNIDVIAQQVMYETTSQLSNRKRENNDFSFELTQNKAKIESLNKSLTWIGDSLDGLLGKFSSFAEYMSIGHVLQSQDELDRQSIALMGYKDSKASKTLKPQKAVIKLDKQCFSCTGQSSVVLNAFKIACLAYAPSPVLFQGEKFTRRELLEYQNKILESTQTRKPESSLDKRQRAASTTMKNYRPVSVPTQHASPRSDFLDPELPRILRKSINL